MKEIMEAVNLILISAMLSIFVVLFITQFTKDCNRKIYTAMILIGIFIATLFLNQYLLLH